MSFKTRIYYKLIITLLSPMSIGSGNNVYTDHDVSVDNNGLPFIPATSITGVIRAYIRSKYGNNISEELFGEISENTNNKCALDCKIRFYDATMPQSMLEKSKCFLTTRDCVKLENKIGVKGAKFDFQIVETGAVFESYIELLDKSYIRYIEEAMGAVNEGFVAFGTKTTRGYGKCSLEVKRAILNSVSDWIKFKMFSQDEWKSKEKIKLCSTTMDYFRFIVTLKSRGGLSIREYSTDVGLPDYSQISLKNNNEYLPVVPGTSWAGAFRNNFRKMMSDEEVSHIFGTVNGTDGESSLSKIVFSESLLTEGSIKDITRNSIDRFSGATKSGALYTERTYYYGKTQLIIDIEKSIGEKAIAGIAVCLADLHNGFLSVGGLTSIGRGLFSVLSVRVGDKDLTEHITHQKPNISIFVKEVSSVE